jgi:hypothetical protein
MALPLFSYPVGLQLLVTRWPSSPMLQKPTLVGTQQIEELIDNVPQSNITT